ncbi:hypothetical protein JYK14_24490 [Siccirubricoccus sp. KC 17139]|uniref:Type IV toxin-antitoxin system AbiEi family antitoxin domain-containing protein n=1 Tax=Siccirubricoccus soli TaxID=2899147 RepID=A0ABT1DDN0_9PROT|nr:type IV toxin-antitoxin system AbiEi family antitoxin domain-containing protein [Siccirubricoccus soli]MCO6419294.1 hypothetical protein [Siccirubricoccus soli]MCP2685429.1 hypothetical protein [Siccirubricoccus soli]
MPIPNRPGAAAHRLLHSIQEAGRPLRMTEIRALNLTPRTVAQAVEEGLVEVAARGHYVPAGAIPPEMRDYAELALRYPKGVFRGPTAAWLHGLIDEEPEVIELATPRSVSRPDSDADIRTASGRQVYMPILSDARFQWGVQAMASGPSGFCPPLAVTEPARTVADLGFWRPESFGQPGQVPDAALVPALRRFLERGGLLDEVEEAARLLGVGEASRRAILDTAAAEAGAEPMLLPGR